MENKKEFDIRTTSADLERLLSMYGHVLSGSIQIGEEQKIALGQIIKDLCSSICKFVDTY